MSFYEINICQVMIFTLYNVYNRYRMMKISNQTREKTIEHGLQLEPGQLVILKVNSAIPSQWTQERIAVVHLGKDNLVCTVKA